VAESELISSTSSEFCELWNGQQIVRVFGWPSACELISLPKIGEDGEVDGRLGRELGATTIVLRVSQWQRGAS